MKIIKEKCIGCKQCIEVCPVGAIYLDGEKANIDSTRCIKCRMCLTVCKVKAIKM